MLKIDPYEMPHQRFHQYLLASVAPRPIAFASTIDAEGNANLSPFSFFNAFGVNPTTLIFSPSLRGRDGSTKNTLDNLKAVPEVVINVVTFDMVNQVSLASTEYPAGVDEFIKAGFGKVSSELVRPYRVKESPVQMECKVRDIIETGKGGGAANLVICEILVMHVDENVLDDEGLIDQHKLMLVGRLGKNHYVKAFGDSLFDVEKPLKNKGIGIDGLPDFIRLSHVLTGNELGQLGNLEKLPDAGELESLLHSPEISAIVDTHCCGILSELTLLAKSYLEAGHAYEALKVLMLAKMI